MPANGAKLGLFFLFFYLGCCLLWACQIELYFFLTNDDDVDEYRTNHTLTPTGLRQTLLERQRI